MVRWVIRTALGTVILAAYVGCAGAPVKQTGPAQPPPERVQAAKKAPEPPPPPALDPREKRRLVRELLRDVEEYHRLLKEKNVEQAVTFFPPDVRDRVIDDLWLFVGRYHLETADVASYQLFVQPDGVLAKVRVVRTLFPKNSVTPERSEIWMTWHRTGERWVLQPQKQK